MLTPTITSLSYPTFPTQGNSDIWFAEMRYRLYHVFIKKDTLTGDDKKALISMFLHAGKHCSDAKKDRIKTALAMFNHSADIAIKMKERDLAITLGQKIQYIATMEKRKVLKSHIDSTYTRVISGGADHLIYNNARHTYVEQESITYKAATWDHYAPQFGLPLNGTMYRGMRLILPHGLTDPGAYTPARLLGLVRLELSSLIKDTCAGSLQHVLEDPDKLILGVLIKEGFLQN